ncbi:MAG: Inner membrane protein YrbG [Alphaproteobacteria bacterium MarineAlpha6_Bin4]|nr:MAG: Inner membrane protein YrbG [Alphaproteobacteria bacterium MarineAlpha6_Bin4]|tara:strand:- start:2024 stop:2956 length:933 start_codon:yes stop_codon:yes gene_type:complete
MFNTILFTISGLFILLISANYLIENIVSLAKKINVSNFIIASCTIAFGTTMPELTTSLKSVLADPPHSGIAVGNLIGSNIANILLIMGISAIIFPVKIISDKLVNLEIQASVVILLFPATIFFFKLDNNISVFIAFLMLLFFIWFFRERMRLEKNNINEKINVKQKTFFLLSKTIFCVIGLILGANFLIDGSVQIAEYYKVSERVIGLSLIAIGTSLPELTTAIIASIKRNHGIALGTVLGANMYNILVLLSLVEIIQPLSILNNIQGIDILVLGVSSFFLVLFIKNKNITKLNGLILLFIYILYVYSIY